MWIGVAMSMRVWWVVLIVGFAYWLYIDGVNTIIKMAVDYGLSQGLSATDVTGAILLTNFLGFPAAIAFGALGARIGARSAIYLALVVYIVATVLAVFLTSAPQFYGLAATIGLRADSVGRVRMPITEGLAGLVAEQLLDALVDLGLGALADLQPEADVLRAERDRLELVRALEIFYALNERAVVIPFMAGIGGRGTRGAVYRVRFPQGLKGASKEAAQQKLTQTQALVDRVAHREHARAQRSRAPGRAARWPSGRAASPTRPAATPARTPAAPRSVRSGGGRRVGGS